MFDMRRLSTLALLMMFAVCAGCGGDSSSSDEGSEPQSGPPGKTPRDLKMTSGPVGGDTVGGNMQMPPEQMFGMLDRDQDGTVSGDEIPESLLGADTDGDGTLSMEEFRVHEEASKNGGASGDDASNSGDDAEATTFDDTGDGSDDDSGDGDGDGSEGGNG